MSSPGALHFGRYSGAALLSGVLVSLSAGVVQAQDGHRVLRGQVRDSREIPVGYARVHVSPLLSTVTDDSGYFALRRAPRRQFGVDVRRMGFRSERITIPGGSDTTVVIVLHPLAQSLEATVIQAQRLAVGLERRGFYERLRDSERGIGRGTFFTSEDLERRGALRVTEMMADVPGVRVRKTCLRSDCNLPVGTGDCPLTVYLDGGRLTSASGRPTGLIDELVGVHSVAGVEVYPRALNAPLKYPSVSGTCGVIVIWTKS